MTTRYLIILSLLLIELGGIQLAVYNMLRLSRRKSQWSNVDELYHQSVELTVKYSSISARKKKTQTKSLNSYRKWVEENSVTDLFNLY